MLMATNQVTMAANIPGNLSAEPWPEEFQKQYAELELELKDGKIGAHSMVPLTLPNECFSFKINRE